MNRMVQNYDLAMRNNPEAVNKLAAAEARAEKAERERDAAVSEATEAKLAREEAEREAYVNKENALKLAESNMRIDSKVVRCKRMLAEARGLEDSEVARAAQKARREVSEVFLAKFKVAEEKAALLEDANDQFMYLSQARANAQLIKVLEEGGSLEAEKAQVEEWLSDVADAEMKLMQVTSDLKEALKAPVSEPTLLSPGEHRSVKTLADEVGVTDQYGWHLLAADVLPFEPQEYTSIDFFFFTFVPAWLYPLFRTYEFMPGWPYPLINSEVFDLYLNPNPFLIMTSTVELNFGVKHFRLRSDPIHFQRFDTSWNTGVYSITGFLKIKVLIRGYLIDFISLFVARCCRAGVKDTPSRRSSYYPKC